MASLTVSRRAPMDLPTSSGALTVVGPNLMESLPGDVIFLIFTRSITTSEFSAFSETCRRMHQISHTIPVYAFKCGNLSYVQDLSVIGNIPVNAFNGCSLSGFVLIRNKMINQSATQLIFAKDSELSNSENEFYDACKKACFQKDGINYENLPFYMFKAINFINAFYFKHNIPSTQQKLLSDVSMKAVLSRLHEKTYNDIIDMITDQLTESVTFDSFKSSAQFLARFFHSKSSIDIEVSLRKALKVKYGKAFYAFAIESSKTFPTEEFVTKVQQQLRNPLEAKKAAIEAELAILSGPSRFNGTVNDAYVEWVALEDMRDEPIDEDRVERAMKAFRMQYGREYPASLPKDMSAEEMLNFTRRMHCSPRLQRTLNELQYELIGPLAYKRMVALNQFFLLSTRQDRLAQWDESTGTLIGGKLFEVRKKLEDINCIPLTIIRQMGEFYAHLFQPVLEENKKALYDSLQALPASWSA